MQNYEHLYNSAPCGLLSFDLKGRIYEVNYTFANWVQLSREEILSKHFPELLDKGGRFYYELFVLPLLRMNQMVKEVSLTVEAGENAFSALFSASVSNVDGAPVVNASFFKIEDRKKFEQELLKKKEKAESDGLVKTKALEEVAFNQAHLIRAPLANVLALVKMLEEMDLGQEAKEVLTLLSESSYNLDQQIRIIVDKSNLH